MARPKKEGFDYFPMDVDFFSDRKIRRILTSFGAKGIVIYHYLLCAIYKENGCFMRWDEDCAFDVADDLKMKESFVKEVLSLCLTVGLFDAVLMRVGVLTSDGIQSRYETMCKLSRREPFALIELKKIYSAKTMVNSEETQVFTEETQINDAKSTQSKVKEIIIPSIGDFENFEEKNNENQLVSKNIFIPPKIDEIIGEVEIQLKKLNSYDAENAKYISEKFFNYWVDVDWMTQSGIKLVAWRSRVKNETLDFVKNNSKKQKNDTNKRPYQKTNSGHGASIVESGGNNRKQTNDSRFFQG